jgi:hypothetical protein
VFTMRWANLGSGYSPSGRLHASGPLPTASSVGTRKALPGPSTVRLATAGGTLRSPLKVTLWQCESARVSPFPVGMTLVQPRNSPFKVDVHECGSVRGASSVWKTGQAVPHHRIRM